MHIGPVQCIAVYGLKRKVPRGSLALSRLSSLLFLYFVVLSMSFAPLTVLCDFNFALNKLLILAGPIVNTLTFLARELYESILRHGHHYTQNASSRQPQ